VNSQGEGSIPVARLAFLQRIQSLVADWRIGLSFIGHNRAARAEWHARAGLLFDTTVLQAELESRQGQLDAQSRRMYGAEIELRGREQATSRAELQNLLNALAFFQRNYQEELQGLYRRLDKIKLEQRECREKLNEAYADLEQAKDDIDSWYRKSQRSGWLLGNAGKPLARHSLFGQSFGDLDALKDDRDQAGETIGAMKQERDRLSRTFAAAREEINRVKADRDEYFRLQREGHSMRSLEQDITSTSGTIAKLGAVLVSLTGKRDAWEQAERETRGLRNLEAEIASIKAQRQAYLAEFECPSAIARRRAEHRAGWLQESRKGSQGG
jgi:uncharacterized coiled-coil DUF342 family protein